MDAVFSTIFSAFCFSAFCAAGAGFCSCWGRGALSARAGAVAPDGRDLGAPVDSVTAWEVLEEAASGAADPLLPWADPAARWS